MHRFAQAPFVETRGRTGFLVIIVETIYSVSSKDQAVESQCPHLSAFPNSVQRLQGHHDIQTSLSPPRPTIGICYQPGVASGVIFDGNMSLNVMKREAAFTSFDQELFEKIRRLLLMSVPNMSTPSAQYLINYLNNNNHNNNVLLDART